MVSVDVFSTFPQKIAAGSSSDHSERKFIFSENVFQKKVLSNQIRNNVDNRPAAGKIVFPCIFPYFSLHK